MVTQDNPRYRHGAAPVRVELAEESRVCRKRLSHAGQIGGPGLFRHLGADLASRVLQRRHCLGKVIGLLDAAFPHRGGKGLGAGIRRGGDALGERAHLLDGNQAVGATGDTQLTGQPRNLGEKSRQQRLQVMHALERRGTKTRR